MTQMYADKTVSHLRPSASSADKVTPGHVIACANPGSAADSSSILSLAIPSNSRASTPLTGALLLLCPILKHVDVMPRQPHTQLRAPDRLRFRLVA
jgi:hypothetical protein